jgi:hypothetical protein
MARSLRRKQRSRALQTAAFLWTIWKWLPPTQKRRALLLARRHGPGVVSGVLKRRRRHRSRR